MKNQITSKILKFAFAWTLVLLASSYSEDNDTLGADSLAQENAVSETLAKGAKITLKEVAIGSFSYTSTVVCLGNDLTVIFDNIYAINRDYSEVQIQYSLNSSDWFQLDKGTVTDGVFTVTFIPEAGT